MGCVLSKGRNKQVYPKRRYLNSDNNESYAYLKSIGVNWKYDPNNVHLKLHSRLYRRFDTFDLVGDNRITLKEVLFWPDLMTHLVKANEEENKCLRDVVKILFRACGVNEEGLHREDWVEANQAFAEAEKWRKKRGEQPILGQFVNAYLDVIDKEGDGTVGLDQLKMMMRAFRVPQWVAFTFFDAADVKQSSRLERQEIHDLVHNFWLEEYNPEYDAIHVYDY